MAHTYVIGRNLHLDYWPAHVVQNLLEFVALFTFIIYFRYSLTVMCVLKMLDNHLRDKCSPSNVRLKFYSGIYTFLRVE